MVVGAHADDADGHLITGSNVPGDGGSNAQHFVVHVGGDDEYFHLLPLVLSMAAAGAT